DPVFLFDSKRRREAIVKTTRQKEHLLALGSITLHCLLKTSGLTGGGRSSLRRSFSFNHSTNLNIDLTQNISHANPESVHLS
ncbi:mCG144579, partial [Mus musculus]